jgi:hypothetical protein
MRTFGLNSPEFYEAVCEPREMSIAAMPGCMARSAMWIPNGALPREPRVWEREVVVERRRGKR